MKDFVRPVAACAGLALLSWAAFAKGPAWIQAEPSEASGPFSFPAPPEPDSVRMLRFPDGSVRFGAITDHDADGFELTRLDTSGRVRLQWGMLDESQASELRNEFGYVEVEASEIFVQGERLLFEGGGSVTGVVLSREGDHFLVKTEGNVQRIPKVRVRSIETRIQIPALDVYTSEELYAQMLGEADLTSAAGLTGLAENCEAILDFVHAAEHYAAAIELGVSGDEATRVEQALARAQVKAEAQGQLEVLRSADKERRRGNYDEAIAIVQAFPSQFPDSALIEDARKAEAKLLEARDAAAADLVAKRWTFWAKRLTRAKAVGEGTFEEMRTWAVEALPNEIQARVHADLLKGVSAVFQPDDVRTLWEGREKRRWTSSTYGSAGTWLLGAEAAQAGIDAAPEPDAAPVSAADAERKAITERIRRYAQNQRRAQRGGAAEAEAEQRDEFWRSWSGAGRSMWLLSYYAENGGDYELRENPMLRNCSRCAGEGAISVVATATVSNSELSAFSACPLCHGVQVVRRISFR